MGYCKGIENYSRIFDGRRPGEPPYTVPNYFPKDYMMFIDEPHVTLPQFHGMNAGDRSREENLVNYGFRLPCAYDNRPLRFEEFEKNINQAVFVSATPDEYEIENSGRENMAEQIVRPTGLIDPEVTLKPAKGQVDDLMQEIESIKESVYAMDRFTVPLVEERKGSSISMRVICCASSKTRCSGRPLRLTSSARRYCAPR